MNFCGEVMFGDVFWLEWEYSLPSYIHNSLIITTLPPHHASRPKSPTTLKNSSHPLTLQLDNIFNTFYMNTTTMPLVDGKNFTFINDPSFDERINPSKYFSMIKSLIDQHISNEINALVSAEQHSVESIKDDPSVFVIKHSNGIYTSIIMKHFKEIQEAVDRHVKFGISDFFISPEAVDYIYLMSLCYLINDPKERMEYQNFVLSSYIHTRQIMKDAF